MSELDQLGVTLAAITVYITGARAAYWHLARHDWPPTGWSNFWAAHITCNWAAGERLLISIFLWPFIILTMLVTMKQPVTASRQRELRRAAEEELDKVKAEYRKLDDEIAALRAPESTENSTSARKRSKKRIM